VTTGPRPTPTALKLVKGNPGKRAMNRQEASVALAEPTPPAFLSDDAKVEWGRVVGVLYRAGLMTEIDRAALAAYCQAYGRWAQAERALARMAEKDTLNAGLIIRTKNDNAIQNPLVGIANTAKRAVVKYAAEFGMTPSARTRVNANPDDEKPENPAAKYFG
jgi:P27 family predicted phage terminase small subunit